VKREELNELRAEAEAAVLRAIVNTVTTASSTRIQEYAQAVALLRTKPEQIRSGGGAAVY
jgi:hypothetical protein